MRFPLDWEWYDWSLNVVVSRYPDGRQYESRQLFSLKCCSCGRFSLGCAEHWFCGYCEACKAVDEMLDDEPQADPAVGQPPINPI